MIKNEVQYKLTKTSVEGVREKTQLAQGKPGDSS